MRRRITRSRPYRIHSVSNVESFLVTCQQIKTHASSQLPEASTACLNYVTVWRQRQLGTVSLSPPFTVCGVPVANAAVST